MSESDRTGKARHQDTVIARIIVGKTEPTLGSAVSYPLGTAATPAHVPSTTGSAAAKFAPVPHLGHQAGLDGIRGIAVALVVLYHARVFGFKNGSIGVEVFFVLSGFLITTLLLEEFSRTKRISFKNFYRRRVARLLPVYFAVVVACVIAEVFARQGGTYRGVVTSFFYISNWSRILFPDRPLGMLTHTWTLSIEEQFYLLWPLALLILARRTMNLKRIGLIIGLIIVGFSIEVLILASFGGRFENYILNGADTHAPMLLSGALLAVTLAYCRSMTLPVVPRGRLSGAVAIVALIALITVAELEISPFSLRVVVEWPIIVVATLVLIVEATSSKGPVRWLLTRRPAVAVGAVSYGLYLWHFPIFFLTDTVLGLDTFLAALVALAASVVVTVLSYRYLEKPARRRLAPR